MTGKCLIADTAINPVKATMIIYPSNQSKIIEIEEQSLNAWPAIHEIHHKGCVLRFSNGYAKRANSANPLYFTDDCHELIRYAEEAYTGRSLPTVFKMIKHKRYEALDSALDQKGYGRMIMNKLLHTAKKGKCIYSYLQVMNDNAIAGKLYQSLGYRQYYKYWYRVKPAKGTA